MYTKQRDTSGDDNWMIITPKGDYICNVNGEANADNLLKHLNRKNK